MTPTGPGSRAGRSGHIPKHAPKTFDKARAERRELEREDLHMRGRALRLEIDAVAGLLPRIEGRRPVLDILVDLGRYLDDLDDYLKERP